MSDNLEDKIRLLPLKPGVYRMYDASGALLYVGKARQLRRRVAQYFIGSSDSAKTAVMVNRVRDVQTTVTHTEAEALLLEQTLIKQHRPPFNILLKDDKSYPYLRFDLEHDFPRVSVYRAKHLKAGPRYYGPFVSGSAVRDALNFLQKQYQIRQCEDVFFRHRSRPCLQHQIGRCSAPCVGQISREAYRALVERCRDFLEGRQPELIEALVQEMETASAHLDFERAALFRDQIVALRAVQARQHVKGQHGDVDAVAVSVGKGLASVNVLHVRDGSVVGHQHFLVDSPIDVAMEELDSSQVLDHDSYVMMQVLDVFLPQFYLNERRTATVPSEIVLPVAVSSRIALEEALRARLGRVIRLVSSVRTEKAAWLRLSTLNASEYLLSHASSKETQLKRFLALQNDLSLTETPERLECFDISHTGGEGTVASCVVFDQNGPKNSDYRRFNIENITGGDDYAALEQAVMRRYRRLRKEEARLPDIIIIDGGPGQINRAREVLDELQVTEVVLLSVAKGASRKFGRETFYESTPTGLLERTLSPPAFGLVAHIRDEAHRFAISGHRARRNKKRIQSPLEGIEGVGPKRRRLLLTHFGGIKGVRSASVEDLIKLPGINRKLAEGIVEALKAQ
ncbi:MAG: excinuclease ABC subunit UvrC [Gammaproteobacteria bacterium]